MARPLEHIEPRQVRAVPCSSRRAIVTSAAAIVTSAASSCFAAALSPRSATAYDLGSLLDAEAASEAKTRQPTRYEQMRGMGDTAAKADALRQANAAEDAQKQKRAEKVISRAEQTALQKEQEAEKIRNSGVPPCDESGPWGAGVRTAKPCLSSCLSLWEPRAPIPSEPAGARPAVVRAGSATGLLSAKACSRVRDGFVNEKKRSGFFLIG